MANTPVASSDLAQNPLFNLAALPQFDQICAEHVAPAIEALLADARSTLDRLESADTPATWQDFVQPLIDNGERLGRSWGVVGHLHSVKDTPPWREAYNALLPEVTRYWSGLGQSLALFDKYRSLANSAEYAQLNAVKQRIVDNALRDFRLSGAELADDQKPRFQAIQEEMAAISAKFSENVLDATNAWTLLITESTDLDGMPEDAIAAAAAAAEAAGKTGYLINLHFPSFFPVLQYANKRSLRETVYRANATRASEFSAEQGHPEWDNSDNIARLLALRHEEANMLGYDSYAAVSVVAKMAESPAQVLDFIADLATKARPFAQADIAALREFASAELGLADLQAWDLSWASEKLRQARYAFSEHEVKQYFPEPKVIAGLFSVIEGLYGVKLSADQTPTWHKDVKFYRIERDGQLLGQFYLDLYAREGKRGGAWMDEVTSRRRLSNGTQTPVAYLVCNFTPPLAGKAATFSHDEVQTLFHEAGHGLHHLLTQIEELPLAGIRGVEWDAVELPSQFMENFCWEWDVLQNMTAHCDSGDTLPRALYDKMIAARNFQSGMQTIRQLIFSRFDMQLHDAALGGKTAQQVFDLVQKELAVFPSPDYTRFANSFSHIFAGGYAAGYYSYKWAEVLSADAYAAFEEAAEQAGSTLDRATGTRFMQEVLAVGGSRSALESFKAFRGREPQVDALLRHSGMVAA